MDSMDSSQDTRHRQLARYHAQTAYNMCRVYLTATHLTDAVHGQLRCSHIQCTATNATSQNRTNGRATEHVIADAELLSWYAAFVGKLPAKHCRMRGFSLQLIQDQVYTATSNVSPGTYRTMQMQLGFRENCNGLQ